MRSTARLNRAFCACLLGLLCLPGTGVAEQAGSELTAASGTGDGDPWQGMNRKIHGFNDFLDRNLLRPVAKGYDTVVPDPAKRGIGNVFTNLGTPAVAVNQLLQGKPRRGASDLGRFLINTTVGLGGIIDVAGLAGLKRHDEDFGQTLGTWGLSQGPYLVIPFRGPSSVTHAGGMLVDTLMNPLHYFEPRGSRYAARTVDVVHTRAELISSEALISGDEYLFIRDAYQQRRTFQIADGVIEEDPFLDEFDDWDE